MTAWTDLVKKVYNEHKGEAGYKLGDAMKEAKKQYKKGSYTEPEPMMKTTKTKTSKKKGRKSRKSRKNRK